MRAQQRVINRAEALGVIAAGCRNCPNGRRDAAPAGFARKSFFAQRDLGHPSHVTHKFVPHGGPTSPVRWRKHAPHVQIQLGKRVGFLYELRLWPSVSMITGVPSLRSYLVWLCLHSLWFPVRAPACPLNPVKGFFALALWALHRPNGAGTPGHNEIA